MQNYLNFSNLTSSHGGGGARNCAYEDMNAAPCENHAKHCNSVGQAGQCVTKGICCNPKGNIPADIIINILETLNATLETVGRAPNAPTL